MQATAPLVLVSCANCHQLHEPHSPDASHPLCSRCTPLLRRPNRYDTRPRSR